MSILELMAAPFVECIVLVAIHTYLGIHVLKRRVIFVDLALAQIAALGTTVGFIFGIMPETPGALFFSMAFTFVGAAVFSITRFRTEKIPQEAIIGLTYAISFAISVLVVDKTRGAEHLKDILVGNLLWVTWSDVATAAIVYLAVGLIHFGFRDKFLLISDHPDRAYRAGMAVRAWDFLFYLTFGVVIAFSTRVAGVLLVFVFLVAPAILAFLITDRMWLQLLIGWTTGTVVTVVGLYLSWVIDLPSGPTVIAFYGTTLIAASIVVYLVRAENRARAFRWVTLGIAGAAIVGFALWASGHWIGSTEMSLSDQARQADTDTETARKAAGSNASEAINQRKAALASRVGDCVGPDKTNKYLSLEDIEERLSFIRSSLRADKRQGLEFLLIALSDDELPLLYREESIELLVSSMGDIFGYDIRQTASNNTQALKRICDAIGRTSKSHATEKQGD